MSFKSFFPTLWDHNQGCKNPYCHLQYDLDRTSENPTDLLPLVPRTAAMRHATYSHNAPELDLSESDDELTIEVELPGVELEDIEVFLDGSNLIITGEKQSHKKEQNAEYRIVERSCGHYKRILPLGFEADENTIKAKYRNGVLTVKVAKSTAASPPG